MEGFRLGGVRVRVSFSFLLAVSLFLLLDRQRRGGMLLLSVMLHESAHILALFQSGSRPAQLGLYPFGVRLTPDSRRPLSYRQERGVFWAGPLASLALAGLLFLLRGFHPALLPASAANLVLGCFNLLPIPPLDGGRILASHLSERLGPGRGQRVLRAVSLLVLTPLTALGLLLAGRGGNPSLLITCLFLAAGRDSGARGSFR